MKGKYFVGWIRNVAMIFLCTFSYSDLFGQVNTYVPQNKLSAWYNFNGSIADSSVNLNNLTNSTGVLSVSDRSGKSNGAKYFNGKSHELRAPHSSSISVSNDLTIACWVLDSITTSKYQTIIAKRQFGLWNYSLTISHDNGISKKGRNKIVTSRGNTGPAVDFKFSLDSILLNRWVHLAVTIKNDTVNFFINGKNAGTLLDTNSFFPNSFGNKFAIAARDPLCDLIIGSNNEGAEFFRGRLDDVGIWKRSLSDCEIRGLYFATPIINKKAYHGNTFYQCGIDSIVLAGLAKMKSYSWSNGVIKQKNAIKKSGKYSLIATDSIGCKFYDTIQVVFSNPQFKFSSDSIFLKNCQRDSLRIGVGKGWINTDWSNGKKDSFVFLKNTGFYWVKMLDTNGCPAGDTFYFGNAGKMDISLISVDSVKCNGGSSGKISSQISGGFAPYKLLWDDPMGQTTITVNNLAAGKYTGIVNDRFGCKDTVVATVYQPLILYASIAATDSINCFGGSDGRAYVVVSGGVQPYNFKWNDPLLQTVPLAINLKVGSYNVSVGDKKGCITSATAKVVQPDKLIATILKSDSALCFQTASGQAECFAKGGNGRYFFNWSDSLKQKTAKAINLKKGSYKVVINDQYGCGDSAICVINEPRKLSIKIISVDSANCYGIADGKASVAYIGGTMPVGFFWDDVNKQKSANAVNLSAGKYVAIVKDAKGCVDSTVVTINQPNRVSLSFIKRDSVSCYGRNDGRAEVFAVGGTGKIRYLWNDPSSQSTALAIGLGSRFYKVFATDQYFCKDSLQLFIAEPEKLTVYTNYFDSVTCFGAKDGKWSVLGYGGNGGYDYYWNDSLKRKLSIAYNLNSIRYSVRLVDLKGCKDSLNFVIPQPARLTTIADVVDSVNCFNGADGRIIAKSMGGNGGYQFKWNDKKNQDSNVAVGLNKGVYQVKITDLYGCQDSMTAAVFEPLKVSINVVKVDSVSCFKFSDGVITTTTIGGTGSYRWDWNSNPRQGVSRATGLPAGDYTVVVSDNYGCTDSAKATVFEPDSITLEITTSMYTMKGEKHQMSYVAKPIQPYTFSWEPASVFVSQAKLSTPNVIFQNSTLVKLTITNLKGCPLSDTAIVKVVLPPKEIMPTGFTPNRDLLNDGFGMPSIFETQDIRIYNRLGVLVFRGDSQHPKWDGSVNGVLADEGVYYYTLLARLRGTEQWVKYGGNVTLLR